MKNWLHFCFCRVVYRLRIELISLQAACGLINNPKDSIEDIDGADVGNELAVTEYVDDIYKFYKLTEVIIFRF